MPGHVSERGYLTSTGTPFTDGVTDPANYATYGGTSITGPVGTGGIGSPYYHTEVGEWENSASPYATFDQSGNVWEWDDSLLYDSYRGLRGGSFLTYWDFYLLRPSIYTYNDPSNGYRFVGFRVASIPEPSALPLASLALLGLLCRRRR